MARRPTLSEVAAAAKVSLGTASNVMNAPERVRTTTRERVYAAMRELGYRPPGLIFPADRDLPVPEVGGGDKSLPLLLVVGYISVDLIARVDVMPHRSDRITADRISKQLGGPAANVAVAAASLGAPFAVEVELATAIGKDPDSLWALKRLAERGVRARAVQSPFNQRLSRCIVLVEHNGARTKINEPLTISRDDLIPHLHAQPPRRPSHLHADGYQVEAIAPALAGLRRLGWGVSAHDTGLADRYCTADGFATLTHDLESIFINRRTAYRILGRQFASEHLVSAFNDYLGSRDAGCDVILTLGRDGAAVFPHGAKQPIRATAPAVGVVDGTGAGDCFVGTYLAQRLHGAARHDAAARACIGASLSMTAEGAQGCRVTSADLDRQASGVEA